MNCASHCNTVVKRCNEVGIQVLPYGNGWWLLGHGISRVVGELAGLSPEDLPRFQITPR